MRERIILHVDMDQFFAAVEMRENPALAGKPVVVGADPKGGRGRGVVSTCNYEARKFGIRSGMPISEAYRLCPNCVFLPVNAELYWRVSGEVMEILKEYADRFEQISVDEAWLDISSRVGSFEEAEEYAKRIQRDVFEKTKLTCSVGIGPNKLIAKMASGMKKPNGITVVPPEKVHEFLYPLPIDNLWGVGKKTAEMFERMGIKTIGDLARYDAARIVEEFGAWGGQLKLFAQGVDNSEVGEEYERKSIGRHHTFERDTKDEKMIKEAVDEMCKDIIGEALANGILFSNITIMVRFSDFETHTSSRTLKIPTNELQVLRKNAWELFAPYLKDRRLIRLVGVRIAKLLHGKGQKRLGEWVSD
ncbi:MAG: DNA polymerase IV [Candidatus Micrarchaeia archaeon]